VLSQTYDFADRILSRSVGIETFSHGADGNMVAGTTGSSVTTMHSRTSETSTS